MFTDRWRDKEDVVYIHNGILLSHKKEQNNAFVATWMQLEMIILREVSQEEQDKYIPHDIPYMWNLKYEQMIPSMKQEQNHGCREQTGGCKGERLGLADVSFYTQDG